MSRIKKELKKRGISLKRFKVEDGYLLADALKNDYSIEEIVEILLNPKVNCFHFRNSKFAKNVAKRYSEDEDKKWFYSEFLDEFLDITEEIRYFDKKKFNDKSLLYI